MARRPPRAAALAKLLELPVADEKTHQSVVASLRPAKFLRGRRAPLPRAGAAGRVRSDGLRGELVLAGPQASPSSPKIESSAFYKDEMARFVKEQFGALAAASNAEVMAFAKGRAASR
jgi:hypothetical protein